MRPATGTIELDNGGSGYRNSRSANRRPVTGTIDTAYKLSLEACTKKVLLYYTSK